MCFKWASDRISGVYLSNLGFRDSVCLNMVYIVWVAYLPPNREDKYNIEIED